jgi:hypothetical protein
VTNNSNINRSDGSNIADVATPLTLSSTGFVPISLSYGIVLLSLVNNKVLTLPVVYLETLKYVSTSWLVASFVKYT